jgi:helix-turn-helix protein
MNTERNGMGERIGADRPTAKVRPTVGAGHPVAQVRGVLAERVVISTPLDPFLGLQALATYSGLSRRKLRDYLIDPAHPLPCYRVGGKILVRRSEFDTWIARHREVGCGDVDRLVADALKDL